MRNSVPKDKTERKPVKTYAKEMSAEILISKGNTEMKCMHKYIKELFIETIMKRYNQNEKNEKLVHEVSTFLGIYNKDKIEYILVVSESLTVSGNKINQSVKNFANFIKEERKYGEM